MTQLETLAETVRTEAKASYHAVHDALTVKAGRLRERFQGVRQTFAERVKVTARAQVDIDGTEMNLG